MAKASRPASRTAALSSGIEADDLDLMDNAPPPPVAARRPTSHRPAGVPPSKAAQAQEILARLNSKYGLPSSSSSLQQQQQQYGYRRGRMLSEEEEEAAEINEEEVNEGVVQQPNGRWPRYGSAAAPEEANEAEIEEEADDNGIAGTSAIANDDRPSIEASTTSTDLPRGDSDDDNRGASADAYRFLLDHIDAEIAVLQRRHSSATTRRQQLQSRHKQRIKELFELMESPWLLLPTEVPPPFPATGVDVYIKEQQLARRQRHPSNTNEAQDKMFVLALHKNYKTMPPGRKRLYDEAAQYNTAVRREMKHRLSTGCARFETFVEHLQECTAAMVREKKIPELPAPSAHRHPNHQTSARRLTSSTTHHHSNSGALSSKRPAKATLTSEEAGESMTLDSTDEAEEEESKTAPVNDAARGMAAKKKSSPDLRLSSATKRIKKAAAAQINSGGSKRAVSHKSTAKLKPPKKAATAAKSKPKSPAAQARRRSGGKSGSGGATGAVSQSIPLPTFGKLSVAVPKRGSVNSKSKRLSVAARPTASLRRGKVAKAVNGAKSVKKRKGRK